MVAYATFLGLAWGLTYLITRSLIFRPLRKLVCFGMAPCLLVYCEACTGFWIGGVLGAAGYWPRADVLGWIEAAVTACGWAAFLAYLTPTEIFEREQQLQPERAEHDP